MIVFKISPLHIALTHILCGMRQYGYDCPPCKEDQLLQARTMELIEYCNRISGFNRKIDSFINCNTIPYQVTNKSRDHYTKGVGYLALKYLISYAVNQLEVDGLTPLQFVHTKKFKAYVKRYFKFDMSIIDDEVDYLVKPSIKYAICDTKRGYSIC